MKVLFFLAEQNTGLTSLLLGQSIHLSKIVGVHFTYVIGRSEKEVGLRSKLDDVNSDVAVLDGIEFHEEFFKLAVRLKEIIDEASPSIVHVQTNWQFVIAAYVKIRYGKKFDIFYTLHAFRHNFKLKAILAKFMISAMLKGFGKKAVVCSQYTFDNFVNISHKLELIHLGVDDIFFENLKVRQRPISAVISLAFVGEFRYGKNQDMVLNVLSRIVSNTLFRNFHLTLAGNGANLDTCKKFVEREGLGDFVSFPGFLAKTQVYHLLNRSDVAIVPTNSETFGLCIAEPFSLGCCVVSRDVGVAGELIENEINGYIFDNEDDLFNVLSHLLANPSSITKCSGNAFRDRGKFHWKAIAEQYGEMYLRNDRSVKC